MKLSAQTSPAAVAANRANAQLSTGPKTADGKAKSSLNAVKTGLTGRAVLLPSEDAPAYQRHVQAFLEELQPVGPREQFLAQSLADNAWRLERIPALQMAIFSLGQTRFANLFEQEDPALRPALIEVHTFMVYEKQLRNLQLQEARLQRQRAKDTAELRQLRQERIQKEKQQQQMEAAAKLYIAAQENKKPFDPAQFGFVFSNAEIERYLDNITAPNVSCQAVKAA